MRSKFFPVIVLLSLVGSTLLPAFAVQDLITAGNARSSFMNSRPEGLSNKAQSGGGSGSNRSSGRAGSGTPGRRASSSTASGRSNTTVASRSNPSRRNTGNNPPQTTNARTNTTVASNAGNVTNSFVPSAIGLGYTLFMRDASGNPSRVDPSRNFRAGDHLRVNLESNIDGYLYIFHTENGQNPQMLYPDARLNNGSNRIAAHVPYEVPSSTGANEEERWFVFDNKPATERLYIVVTREPLPYVPTETALINYCGGRPQPCTWRPTDTIWASVKTQATDSRVVVNRSEAYGQTQTTDEREAVTRGALLTQRAPEPSVVRMNASSQTNQLVTMIDLTHR
ncbi:MAG: DUF4384 domain-containing protein [Pyrinomonadaceae bacterium]|nr:DUF4384 domain-containing protein [Pyrinomonadaceae bacterium]